MFHGFIPSTASASEGYDKLNLRFGVSNIQDGYVVGGGLKGAPSLAVGRVEIDVSGALSDGEQSAGAIVGAEPRAHGNVEVGQAVLQNFSSVWVHTEGCPEFRSRSQFEPFYCGHGFSALTIGADESPRGTPG